MTSVGVKRRVTGAALPSRARIPRGLSLDSPPPAAARIRNQTFLPRAGPSLQRRLPAKGVALRPARLRVDKPHGAPSRRVFRPPPRVVDREPSHRVIGDSDVVCIVGTPENIDVIRRGFLLWCICPAPGRPGHRCSVQYCPGFFPLIDIRMKRPDGGSATDGWWS